MKRKNVDRCGITYFFKLVENSIHTEKEVGLWWLCSSNPKLWQVSPFHFNDDDDDDASSAPRIVNFLSLQDT